MSASYKFSANAYTRGSTAYKLQPDYREYEARTQETSVRRTYQRKRKKEARQSFGQKVSVRLDAMDAKGIAMLAAVFAGCIALMVSTAFSVQKRLELSGVKAELFALQTENNAITSEIADSANPEYIKQEAKTRLGMDEIKSHQIVYIDVPKESYSVQTSRASQDSDGFSITNILKFIKGEN